MQTVGMRPTREAVSHRVRTPTRSQVDGPDAHVAMLAEELQRYRAHFELAPAAYVVTDVRGRILELNATAVELLDRPSPRALTALVAPPARRELRKLLSGFARGAMNHERVMLPLMPADGRARQVLATISGDQECLRWILQADTETPQACAEEATPGTGAAALQRDELETLLHRLPVAVMVAEAGTRRITLANRHARELIRDATGSDDLDHVADFELLTPDGRSLETRPSLHSIDRGEIMDGKRYAYRSRNASLVVLEVNAAPLRQGDGTITGAVIVAHDVSERERRERAERDFLSNAAHQLRTPVAAIQAAVEALQAGAKEERDTRERFLAHIEGASGRLGQLARSLLILARAQIGEDVRLEPIEIAPILRVVAAGLRPSAQVTVRVKCRSDVVALANPDMLREVLQSLAENAVRHTRHGSITLRAASRGRGYLAVEVADDGPGIEPEVSARMFERFYTGDGNRGFGLGLAIASQAADAMGARLEVDSAVGKGTVASVVLTAGRIVS